MEYGSRNHDIKQKCSASFTAGSVVASAGRMNKLKSGCERWQTGCFLGTFAKLRKTTISFVMSACPSVRMEKLGSQWTDFHDI